MTPMEYLLIGAVSFTGSFLAMFAFSYLALLRKKRLVKKMLEELKGEIETQVAFRDIVQSNFGSGDLD